MARDTSYGGVFRSWSMTHEDEAILFRPLEVQRAPSLLDVAKPPPPPPPPPTYERDEQVARREQLAQTISELGDELSAMEHQERILEDRIMDTIVAGQDHSALQHTLEETRTSMLLKRERVMKASEDLNLTYPTG